MEFMPEHAPLVVMAFLGTAALLALLLLLFLVAIAARKKWLGILSSVLAALLLAAYFLVLVGVSLASHEKLLALGERKYFCEIDCHLAYSVEGVEETSAFGDELHQTRANGRFIVVRLKTWFDPSTISAHRGNGPLSPGQLRILLIDNSGRKFFPSPQAAATLAKLRGPSSPLSQPLRPGDSYISLLVFDVPVSVHNPRLFVGDDYALPDRLLIGHEDSFFHKKIFMALTSAGAISAGRLP